MSDILDHLVEFVDWCLGDLGALPNPSRHPGRLLWIMLAIIIAVTIIAIIYVPIFPV